MTSEVIILVWGLTLVGQNYTVRILISLLQAGFTILPDRGSSGLPCTRPDLAPLQSAGAVYITTYTHRARCSPGMT
jgi:hypothetical protein